MNKKKVGSIFLIIVAVIGVLAALMHMSCIFLGESCYRFQLAPDIIVQSSLNGSLLAPIGTTIVSSLFLFCAIYALSAARIIVRLPLLIPAIYSISALCVFRGIGTIPISLAYPDMVSNFSIVAGMVWLILGVLLLFGYRFINASPNFR